MKIFIVIVSLVFATAILADQQVTGDDGRQIQLNDDGSWTYMSNDRYATTADGKRVRLMESGQWVYTGEKTVAQKTMLDQRYIDEQLLDVSLTDLVIESYKADSHKGSRKKTRSVFYLNFALAKQAEESLILDFQSENFSVEDSDGRDYSLLKLQPETLTIQPGSEITLAIYADGSPHWWTTKSMLVKINKLEFNSAKDVLLSRPMSMAKKKDVEKFE